MASVDFHCIWGGVTAGEAFRNGVQDAFYWHGHCGYSGTICEKPGYSTLDLGKKLTVDEAGEIANELSVSWRSLTPRLIELIGDEELAFNFANIFNDKWGDAVAMQLDDNSWYFCGLASE